MIPRCHSYDAAICAGASHDAAVVAELRNLAAILSDGCAPPEDLVEVAARLEILADLVLAAERISPTTRPTPCG